jgi:anaerobic selenocysteine-containing dehydrogenase
VRFAGTEQIREEISRVVPAYALIRTLRSEGDQFQCGGAMLCAGWQFPTPDGKAHFSLVKLPERDLPPGSFIVTTRRGRQFNSMVQGERDAHTGASRGSVLISPADAAELGVAGGERVVLRSGTGSMEAQAMLAPVARGTLQVHWPEGEVLIDRRRRSSASGIPEYTAVVTVEVPSRAEPG